MGYVVLGVFSERTKMGLLYRPSFAMFTCFVILLAGCGPSYEERQQQRETKREEYAQKLQEEERLKIAEVTTRFNAVYFPPKGIEPASFTYEIQTFFEEHADDTIVAKAYLEDLEVSGNDVVVEFLCPIGDYFITKKGVRLRLIVPKRGVGEILKAKRSDPLLRYLFEPDYLVIAKIMSVHKVRKYEFDGYANADEIEIEVDTSRGLVATGQLIEAIPIREDTQ